MQDHLFTGHTKFGAAGGILTILLVNINSGDVIKTILLAALGATVSFFISFVLKYCISRWQK